MGKLAERLLNLNDREAHEASNVAKPRAEIVNSVKASGVFTGGRTRGAGGVNRGCVRRRPRACQRRARVGVAGGMSAAIMAGESRPLIREVVKLGW